ncbi:selenide, water dikinase SelD [Phaeobacter sp.]|uniref:selenide, water dikinase SelD n=1 Tax=Phaeobacter sp. TaxID=1902409 RepID=UPI0025ED230C|nr:selenide, water dikinase SelD [Phaeobacter sp.]
MHQPNLPKTKDVVFVGGGHTHALVLRKWGMRPLAGARLTVINPGPTAPYSGMLPGFVAGHYDRDALDIDLVRLCRFAGARLIMAPADAIDTAAHRIHVPGRPPVAYDLASINIGITSAMPELPGFAEHGIPAKPLGRFAARWEAFRAQSETAHVAVIGGGVAGVELILAMAHALHKQGNFASATLIDRSDILSDTSTKTRARLLQALQAHRVTIADRSHVSAVEDRFVILADGRSIRSDFTTGAAGAKAQGWIGASDLTQQDGFLLVDAHLQTSDTDVFAAGDCVALTPSPRPKAGVYAVRQAPVLYHNLRAKLTGDPLRAYKPQKDYLKLISLGDTAAVGERFGHSFSGPLIWRWKDHIDQTFMDQFRDLPQMEQPTLPAEHTADLPAALGDKPLCGGCGAKLGGQALRDALCELPATQRSDVTALNGDDAAVLHMGGQKQVISTDHLRTFTEDPVVMARIAAVHALGDIWAMGAELQAATATVILPKLSAALQQRTLSEIMQAAGEIFRDAGADIVGGHSSQGDELTIGFTVTGLCNHPPITLAGAEAGDAIILTKPLGTGIIMAGEMAGVVNGAHVQTALSQMSHPQAEVAACLSSAKAMTDVTGFGLLGHLMGICRESGVGADVTFNAVPVLPGVTDLVHSGVRSSLFQDNAALVPNLATGGSQDVLFDPQTAGGLLAAVDPTQADTVLKALKSVAPEAAIIGHFTGTPNAITVN